MHRRAGQREQQAVHQLDLAAVVAQQRRQPAADAEVDPRLRVAGVDAVHVVALLVGHHLQRQLVVVAQEHAPTGSSRGIGGVCCQDVDDREAVLHVDRHEQPRHERKVEGHVALVAVAEVGDGVLRPLVGLGQQHAVRELLVDVRAQLLAERRASPAGSRSWCLRARRGRARRPAAGRRRPCSKPEVDDPKHRLAHRRVVEVQVGLVRVEAVPVVGLGDRIPGPVRGLEVLEDDPRLLVLARACRSRRRSRARGCPAGRGARRWNHGCWSEVWLSTSSVMTRRPRACASRRNVAEVVERAVGRVDVGVVGDVVAVVAQRRRIERQQPEGGDAQVLQVVELLRQPAEVADAVAVAVEERADVQLVDDRVLVPQAGHRESGRRFCFLPWDHLTCSAVRPEHGAVYHD